MFLQTVAEGYFTNQRLKFINDTTNKLYPEAIILNPSSVNLQPLQEKLRQMEYEMSGRKRLIEFAAEDSVKWKDAAENTLRDMNDLDEDVIREIKLVNQIVSEVQSLASNIELGTSAKIDSALNEAKEILKKIKDVSFVNFRDNAVDQVDHANILVSEMQKYNFPVTNLSSTATSIGDKIRNVSAKLDDLIEMAQKAQELANTVDKLNKENRFAAETGNFDVVKRSTTEAKEDLKAGDILNKNASQYLVDTKANIDILREYHRFLSRRKNKNNGSDDSIFLQ